MKRFQEDAKKFGARLKILRTKAKLSAESVARAIEISPSTYREWENGRAITGFPYKNLAITLGVSMSYLLEDTSLKSNEIHKAIDQIDLAVKKLRLLS